MSDPRRELLDIFVGRATRRYGLSGVNQLQHADSLHLRRFDMTLEDPRASTPDFDHYLRHVEGCRKQ